MDPHKEVKLSVSKLACAIDKIVFLLNTTGERWLVIALSTLIEGNLMKMHFGIYRDY